MPCTIDLPGKMGIQGMEKAAPEKDRAVGDLDLVALYYLLRVRR